MRIAAVGELLLGRTRRHHEEGQTTRAAREIVERQATTAVHCADYFDRRDRALIAHETQIDPDGFFFGTPRDLEVEVWPVEEFELAHSRVPTTLPEDDLFAGIRHEEIA